MEYKEDDFLMLSGVQHFTFCRRQWGLIHIDLLWNENVRTAEGEAMHENCHNSFSSESRGKIITSRGMPIFSRTIGASGECDVVEFIKCKDGITLSGHEGNFKVFPVEYKHGSPKETDEDIMQLAAQAICLEEMLCCTVDEGAIFYGQTKRREKVTITDEMKQRVRKMFEEMHNYMRNGYVPKVKPTRSCNACSLKELCMPKLYRLQNVTDYLKKNLGEDSDRQ